MANADPSRSPRVVLVGAAPDTGNLGVSALCYTTVEGLARRGVTDWVIFDYITHRYRKFRMQGLPPGKYKRTGSVNNRRYYRSYNLKRQWHLAGCWPFTNPALRAIRRADVMLSLAGGDSFTDLYGRHRFDTVTLAPRIAMQFNRPLVLLPQTYGPFRDPAMTAQAAEIIRKSALAWARDEESHRLLEELAGKEFNPNRYQLGVDMAFALPAMEPEPQQRDRVEASLHRGAASAIVGFNVSGLLYNDPENAMKQYGLKADYHQVVSKFLYKLLLETRATIVLVPHVVTPPGHYESDIDACEKVRHALCRALTFQQRQEDTDRIVVATAFDHPAKVKWLIQHCDWFCGTRMHSTIAALSTCTPAAAIAYSKKTLGVFTTCSVGEQVADPRLLDTEQVIEKLWTAFQSRERTKRILQESMSVINDQGERQLDEIATFCHRAREQRLKG